MKKIICMLLVVSIVSSGLIGVAYASNRGMTAIAISDNGIWQTTKGDFFSLDENGRRQSVICRQFESVAGLEDNDLFKSLRTETQSVINDLVEDAAASNYVIEYLNVYTVADNFTMDTRAAYTVKNEIIEYSAYSEEFSAASYENPGIYFAKGIVKNLVKSAEKTAIKILTGFSSTVLDMFNVPPQFDVYSKADLYVTLHETKNVKLSWVYVYGEPAPYLGAQTQKVDYFYETALKSAKSSSVYDEIRPVAVSTTHYENPNDLAIQNRYDTFVERITGYTLQITVDKKLKELNIDSLNN